MPVNGGPSEPVLTARNGQDNIARCAVAPASLCVLAEATPDNKQLIFTAFDPVKGRGSELLRIDTEPGATYSWGVSPDGTGIAVLNPSEGRVHILHLDGRPKEEIVPKNFTFGDALDWAADGKGLFVVTRDRAIGADLEKIRPVRYGRAVAHRFFAEDECAVLDGLVGEEWERAFFRCWTRKEAFIKAIGDGLSFPLRAFSVTVNENDPPRILRVEGDPGTRDQFWLTAYEAGAGFEAAIVVEGGPCALTPVSVERTAEEAPR
jgi:hypothetical protein